MTSTASTAHRAQTLTTARGRIGLGLVLYTALVALLWVMPKGEWGLLWLLFAIPAVAFVLLVQKMAGGRATHESRMGIVIGFGVLLAVLWIAGSGFVGAGGSSNGALGMIWAVLNFLWPLVMIAGLLTRFILRKLVPGAEGRRRALAAAGGGAPSAGRGRPAGLDRAGAAAGDRVRAPDAA